MTYEKIYSRFYLKQTDPSFFKLSKEDAYDKMCGWLHILAGTPDIRKCFSILTLDDELNEITFILRNPMEDEESNEDFIIEMFAQGMVICWMRPQIERNTNLAAVVGGKEEKSMLNNYKPNMARLETLEKNLKKFIRDYGYLNNDYIGES